jgi:hypothetical protein
MWYAVLKPEWALWTAAVIGNSYVRYQPSVPKSGPGRHYLLQQLCIGSERDPLRGAWAMEPAAAMRLLAPAPAANVSLIVPVALPR